MLGDSKRRIGYSLPEILVAFGILLVASIAIYSMFTVGVRAARQSGDSTKAINFARHLTELIRVRNLPFTQDRIPPSRNSGLNDGRSERRALNAAPFGESDFSGLPETTQFSRNIRIERLSSDKSSFEYNLMRIQVQVFWSEKKLERSVKLVTLHRQP
jgi:type II secretory pathway pseudopilin PulG